MKLDWNEERMVSFRNKVKDILWYDWDPIGINRDPDAQLRARDEYDSYAEEITLILLRDRISPHQLNEYLIKVVGEYMRLNASSDYQRNKREITCQKIFEVWNNFCESILSEKK